MLLSDNIIRKFNAEPLDFQNDEVFEFYVGKTKARIMPQIENRAITFYCLTEPQRGRVIKLVEDNSDFRLRYTNNNVICFHFPESVSLTTELFFSKLQKVFD